MLMFKSCPRCRGDLYQDRDIYGNYIACFQCGYYLVDREVSQLLGHLRLADAKDERGEVEEALVA